MEKKQQYVENYAITLTLKQATGYIISIVLAVGAIMGVYFKNGAKTDAINERINLMEIRVKTNEATLESGKNERAALRLSISALEIRLSELKDKR